jgi:hypothetical protein
MGLNMKENPAARHLNEKAERSQKTDREEF